MNDSKRLTLPQAAQLIGCDPATLRKWIRAKR
jgi:transposase-like protein